MASSILNSFNFAHLKGTLFMDTRNIKNQIDRYLETSEIERTASDDLSILRGMSQAEQIQRLAQSIKKEDAHAASVIADSLKKSLDANATVLETSLNLSEKVKQTLDKLDQIQSLETQHNKRIMIGALSIGAAALAFGVFALKSKYFNQPSVAENFAHRLK